MDSKRIAILTLRNIYMISCLPRYIKAFGNNKYDVIYWNRYGIEEYCGADVHYPMNYIITNESSKWDKLLGYIKFIRHALGVLKKNNYDKIILLPTQTGILLYPFIKKNFLKKYIIDIRDYTAEKNNLFFKLQTKIVKNSGLAVITSPGFKKFLPEHDYLISHNITYIPDSLIDEYRNREKSKKSNGEKIVISCIGGIRFYDQFKRVIACFKNDERYLLRFIGNGSEVLKEYCEQNGIQNVELVGRFTPDKTLNFYMDTDIIMNLYGNNDPLLDYALSNKLYYAATLGTPILVSPDTYMEEVAVGNGFGFSFDIDNETILDELYEYYCTIDREEFNNRCDDFLKSVEKDEQIFQAKLKEFFAS